MVVNITLLSESQQVLLFTTPKYEFTFISYVF